MKKYNLLLAIVGSVIMGSCSDFLELEPEYLISEPTFYQNASDYETAMIGNYSALQGLYDDSMLFLGELTTDNGYVEWTSPTTSQSECDEMEITPTNTYVNSVWNISFTTISRSNNILARIDGSSLSEEDKNQFKGESYFLRALSYFNLVRFFGDLPIVETSFQSPEEIAAYDMTRKPVAEIYQIIISDLNEAAVLLSGMDLGKSRASEGAALSILGKVYLTQKMYPEAESVLEEVIASNTYALQDDYGVLFTNNNDNLKETIFQINYLTGNVGEGNGFSSIFTPSSFNSNIFPGGMNGSGRLVITNDMIQDYEENDLRRDASVVDSLLLDDGTYQQTPYAIKFVDFTTGLIGDGGIDFIVLRYADVLLMYAETLNEQGRTSEAIPYVDLVRDRAGLDPLSGLSQGDLRIALEHERRVELLNEGHRWFDLVRTDRAIQVMNSYFESLGAAFTVTETELLFPLPQRETDIDTDLKQNPGY